MTSYSSIVNNKIYDYWLTTTIILNNGSMFTTINSLFLESIHSD